MPKPAPEPDDEILPIFVPGLPDRLDDAVHARCLTTALAAVEAAKGDFSRLAPAPTTPQ